MGGTGDRAGERSARGRARISGRRSSATDRRHPSTWWAIVTAGALTLGAAANLVLAPQVVSAASNPVPDTTLSVSTAAPGLGSTFTATVTFNNDSSNDPSTPAGFGPYFDLVVPTAGADGNDGLTIGAPTYLNQTPRSQQIVCTGAAIPHPLTGLPRSCPAGTTLLIVSHPIGSFASDQPSADVTIPLTVSPLADSGTSLSLTVTGGFMFGNSATGTTPILGSSQSTSVTPTVVTLAKTDSSPEEETATGPNYERTYRIVADIATGQTLAPFSMTDRLPTDAVFLGLGAGTTAGYAIGHLPTVGVASAGSAADVTVTWPSATGAAGSDTTLEIRYYVGSRTAGTPGTPTVGTANGSWTTSPNSATGSYSWTPSDTRDPKLTGATAGPTATVNRTNKALTVRKAVSNLTRPSGPNLPGDTLKYLITFDISDYFTLNNLVIPAEVIGQGQQRTTAPTLDYSDKLGAAAGVMPPSSWTTATNSCAAPADPGSEVLNLNISTALAALSHAGAGAVTGGGASGARASGTITFTTTILGTYPCPGPGYSADLNVNSRDSVTNKVTIGADVVGGTSVPADASSTSTTIAEGTFTKSIYAVNGTLVGSGPGTPSATVGDNVTFRLTQTHRTGNTERFSITDFLPQPVMKATQLTTFTASSSASAPPAGTARYGPSDTLHSAPGAPTPVLSVNGASNSFTLNWGTYAVPGKATALTSDVLFTVTVASDPFVDGLYLTNLAQATEGATTTTAADSKALVGFDLTEPSIRVRKGVVATNASGATFAPASPNVTPTGVTFTTTSAGFSGTITSVNLGATLNSNLSGVDAGDLVTFTTLWENVGRGPGGAVGLTVKDTCPLGFDCTTVTNFSVRNGARTSLAYTGSPAAFLGGAGLVLTNAVPSCTSAPGPTCGDTTGKNLVVISYTLPVAGTTIPAQVATNTATTVSYTNTPGGSNFVPGDRQPDADSADVTTRNHAFTKALTSSSAAHTTPTTNLTIGEIGTYQLTITVPEGTMPTTKIVDTLAAGTNRMSVTGVTSVTCSTGITSTKPVCGTPASVTGVGSGTLTADFGTITNSARNSAAETIVITYTAVVNNVSTNSQGVANTNTATLTTVNALGATVTTARTVTTTVQVPVPTLTKTAAPALADAGDLITFTLTLNNPATNSTRNAYDLVLTDPLPANFLTPSAPTLSGAACPAATASGWVGSTLTVTWASLAFAQSCTITFTATLGTTATPVNTALTNTARLTWTTLPGTAAGERTGADGPAGTPNNLAVDATATITPNSSVSKAVTSTGLADTTGATDTAVGEDTTWTITARLPEGTITGGFVITDTLPTGLVYKPGSASVNTTGFAGTLPGSPVLTVPTGTGGGTLTWRWTGTTIIPANVGSTGNTFRITFQTTTRNLAANVAGTVLTNTTAIQLNTGPNRPGTGATVTVVEPLIGIAKNIVQTKASRTETVDVSLTVTNTGTAPAYDVVVTDPLPAGMTFAAAGTLPAGWTRTNSNPVTFTGPRVNVGDSIVLPFTATIVSPATAPAVLSNTASIASDSYPGANTNQRTTGPRYAASSTDTIAVSVPDLAVTKSDGIATIAPGQSTTYTVTVSNVGDGPATGVTVRDSLPANVRAVSAPANGACPAGVVTAGTVTWTLPGTLSAGASASCLVSLTVDRPLAASVVAITNAVNVDDDRTHGTDPNPANNTASDTDTITGGPALTVTKTDDRTSVSPGEELTYRITVTNNGPIEATGVVVTDTMGANTALVDPSGGTGVPIGGNGTLSWNVGSILGDGGSRTVTVTVKVADTVPAGVDSTTNLARATPTNGTTATATDTDTIDAAPDLAITKTDHQTTTAAGATYDYELVVTNKGNQDATGVTVLDTLPDGVTCLDAGATGSNTSPGTCDNNAGTYTAALGALAAGRSVTVTVTVTVADPVAVGIETLRNTAVVDDDHTGGPDPTPADNTASDDTDLAATAQLGISKDDNLTEVRAGDSVTYRIVVTNTGDQDTDTATIIDTLPPGYTVTDSGGGAVTGAVATGHSVTWTAQKIGGHDQLVLTLTVKAPSSFAAGVDRVTNSVTITDPRGTPPDGVTATDSDAVIAAPDLAVTKDDGLTVVAAGQPINWTITVTNRGDQDATGVTVVDTLPAHIDQASVTSIPPATQNGDEVTWDLGTLAAGASISVTLSTAVDDPLAAGVTEVRNSVDVSDDTRNGPDPTLGNNHAEDADGVGATEIPDLAIAKDDGITVVTAGQAVNYTLTATNTGAMDATGVTIVDTLPAGYSVLDAQGGAVTGDIGTGVTVTWTGIDLGGRGGTTSRTLSVRAPGAFASGVGTVTNVVTIDDGPGGDIADSKNQATDTDSVDAVPDLMITKDDGNALAKVGDTIKYTITATNNGTQDATGVVIADLVPQYLRIDDTDSGTASGQDLTWNLGALKAGGTVTRTLTATILAMPDGQISNTATVADDSANGPDPTPQDNTATDTTNGYADLVVTKDNGASTVEAGQTTTWTITVTNDGPAPVKSLDLSDPAPPGTVGQLTFAADKGTYDPGSGLWTGVDLAAGDSVTLKVTGRISPDARATITNTVTVMPNGVPELNPGDNIGTDTDNIVANVDLALTKTHAAGTYRTGDPITWTLTVTNTGPAAAQGVTLIDTIPAGVTLGAVTAIGDTTCVTSERTVTCTADRLAVDGAITVTIVGTLAALEGPIGNTATVTTTDLDTDPVNNLATDPEMVTPTIDLWLAKELLGEVGQTGTTTTWSIVVGNNGPSTTRDTITVTDSPSSGVTLTAASGPGWVCTTPSSSGEIVCRSGEDLASGARLPAITVTGTVTAGPGGVVANAATVTSPEAEAVIANNEGEASGVVEGASGSSVNTSVTPETSSPDETSTDGTTDGASGSLPDTGADPGPAVLGLLFVTSGALLINASRRRHA